MQENSHATVEKVSHKSGSVLLTNFILPGQNPRLVQGFWYNRAARSEGKSFTENNKPDKTADWNICFLIQPFLQLISRWFLFLDQPWYSIFLSLCMVILYYFYIIEEKHSMKKHIPQQREMSFVPSYRNPCIPYSVSSGTVQIILCLVMFTLWNTKYQNRYTEAL